MNDFISNLPILAIATLFLGAFLVSLLGRIHKAVRNFITVLGMTIPLVFMLVLIKPVLLEGQTVAYWMGNWEPVAGWAIGISLEVDALSLFFGLLVTLAIFIVGLYSLSYMKRDDSLVNYYTLFLMLSGSALGLVLSGDLFNIFVMIEIMNFTAVALTAFRKEGAGVLEGAFKYLVVGALGSTSVLVGVALLYSQLHTLNLAQITALLADKSNAVTVASFGFLIIGFLSKAFVFPFHPVEADALTAAPASISMMVSGVLTKCGVYGVIRVGYILFQNLDHSFTQYFVTAFGAISMFLCVTMAFNQHNFKRLLAFHSISQVGYVITVAGLGTALGISSGLYHAFNHTIFKGLLFLAAGAVEHATGSLDLDKLGGLSRRMPRTCVLFLIGAASISGLPPFNGFASKWMIYQATFEKGASEGNFFYIIVCVLALLTSVFTLASFVKVAQSVFFGQLPAEFAQTKEVPVSMRIPMWILAAVCVIGGLVPGLVQKYLLTPAVNAAMNVSGYIDQMMGAGYAAQHGVEASAPAVMQSVGCWQPLSWLLLLVCITFAVCLVAVLGTSKRSETAADTHAPVPLQDERDPKYESFFSGEQAIASQVGGSDLFWGFKRNWRHYFSFMHNWHSGVVNDYALYGAAAIALSLVLCVIFL